jgi:hypothetical protein
MAVLNNYFLKGKYGHKQVGCLRHLGCSKTFVQQGRSQFCARSVLPVREHGKLVRTPLAAFFNSPNMALLPIAFSSGGALCML